MNCPHCNSDLIHLAFSPERDRTLIYDSYECVNRSCPARTKQKFDLPDETYRVLHERGSTPNAASA